MNKLISLALLCLVFLGTVQTIKLREHDQFWKDADSTKTKTISDDT